MKITTKFDVGTHLYRVVHKKRNDQTTSSLVEYVIVGIDVKQYDNILISYCLEPEKHFSDPDRLLIQVLEDDLNTKYYHTREQALAKEVERAEQNLVKTPTTE